MGQHDCSAGRTGRAGHLVYIGVTDRHIGHSIFPKQLMKKRAVQLIGISGLHQRQHNMLFKYRNTPIRTAQDQIPVNRVFFHNFFQHHLCAAAPFLRHPFAIGMEQLRLFRGIDQQVRLPPGRRVTGGKFHTGDHADPLFLSAGPRLRPPGHGIVVGQRDHRQPQAGRHSHQLPHRKRSIRIPGMVVQIPKHGKKLLPALSK